MVKVKFYDGLYHGLTATYPHRKRALRAIEAAAKFDSIGIITSFLAEDKEGS